MNTNGNEVSGRIASEKRMGFTYMVRTESLINNIPMVQYSPAPDTSCATVLLGSESGPL